MLGRRVFVASALAVALLAAGCAKEPASVKPEASVKPVAAPTASASPSADTSVTALKRARTRGLGAWVLPPLYDPRVPGVSLSDTLAKAVIPISLPDTRTAGDVVKVIKSGRVKEPETLGLGILYSSGVELFVRPGNRDLKERLAQTLHEPPKFADGSTAEEHFALEKVGTHEVFTQLGGQQSGAWYAPSAVIFNYRGFTYDVYAPGPGRAEAPQMGMRVPSRAEERAALEGAKRVVATIQ